MEDKFFKQDAKSVVDMAFNAKLFKDDLTRDHFNAFEELIEYLLQSRFEGYKKTLKYLESVENYRIKKLSEAKN